MRIQKWYYPDEEDTEVDLSGRGYRSTYLGALSEEDTEVDYQELCLKKIQKWTAEELCLKKIQKWSYRALSEEDTEVDSGALSGAVEFILFRLSVQSEFIPISALVIMLVIQSVVWAINELSGTKLI